LTAIAAGKRSCAFTGDKAKHAEKIHLGFGSGSSGIGRIDGGVQQQVFGVQ
jgi:hypothetical protein